MGKEKKSATFSFFFQKKNFKFNFLVSQKKKKNVCHTFDNGNPARKRILEKFSNLYKKKKRALIKTILK